MEAGELDALSIRDLYRRIDRAVRGAVPGQVWVSGEIRSMNVSSKGHCYIDLVDPVHARDASPVLRVICWASRWGPVQSTLAGLGITLDAGMAVRVRGEVQLYQGRGEISFVLSRLDTDALLGKVAAERVRLVKALVDEGLFDRNRLLPVPVVPLRIGLVASPGTEGYRDFVGSLQASGMAFDVRAVPTQVQGRAAARSVASALRRLDTTGCDLIAVVRGGGSKADLAVFDSEPVARSIALCSKPVWTGIGHTGDESVADQVANASFITPTECGRELARRVTEFWSAQLETGERLSRLSEEQVARSGRALDRHRHRVITGARSQLGRHSDRLAHLTQVLRGSARGRVEAHRHRLAGAGPSLARSAVRVLASQESGVALRAERMSALPDRLLRDEDARTGQWRRLLGAYDFQRQLERGYSVTRDADGRVVRSAARLAAGSLLFTQLADGSAVSEVRLTDRTGERTTDSTGGNR
jgi:exodeoxyribonuclease VII large subunit